MQGHVARRGRSWGFVLDLPRREDGKRRQRWWAGYRTKKEAARAMVEELARLNNGTFVAPSKATAVAYLREWLQGQRARLRPSTWESYRMNIEKHVIPHIGDTLLQNVSADALNAMYAALLESGRKDGAGLSGRSVRYVHVITHHALKDAFRRGRVARNVAALTDPPKGAPGHEKIRVWDLDQARAFLAYQRDDRLYAFWVLALSAGMRRGELAGLRWSDVDHERGKISIQQTLTAVHGKVATSTPKTARGRRSIALDAETLGALKAHRRRQAAERIALGPIYENNDLVFAAEDGKPLHPDRLSKVFQAHVRKADLPLIRLHDLRHTAATLMLRAGLHPKIVSECLGHSGIGLTLDVYSHVLPDMQEERAEKMGRMLFGT